MSLAKRVFARSGVMLALALPALPSTAVAAGWDPVGSTHVLTSNALSFTVPAMAIGWVCAESRFHGEVASALALTITSASFAGCSGTGTNATGCAVNTAPTNLGWRATGLSTTNVTIDGVNFDGHFSGTCALNGQTVRVTGALSGGTANNATHSVTYSADVGLTVHSALGSFAATVSGTFRDVQQTLIFTD